MIYKPRRLIPVRVYCDVDGSGSVDISDNYETDGRGRAKFYYRDDVDRELALALSLLDRAHAEIEKLQNYADGPTDGKCMLNSAADDIREFVDAHSCLHVWVNASNFEPGPNEQCVKCGALREIK